MQVKKILIVDDDKEILEFLIEIIEDKNMLVSPCSTVKEALELLEKKSYDIVLTDYNIGQRTGKEIIDFVNKNSPKTFTIAMSGDNLAIDKLGVECLYKPFDVNELLKKLPL